MENAKTESHRGRPREFDPETALSQVLSVFREKVYEGTSLADLCEATGLNRPSLYSAFGNKEAMFHKALELYAEYAEVQLRQLEAPVAREAVHGFLLSSARNMNAQGCMTVGGALSCSADAGAIKDELARRRNLTEAAVRLRLERAKAEGDLPDGADPADLAKFVMTVSFGFSVQAAGGATNADLERMVEIAMRAWPA